MLAARVGQHKEMIAELEQRFRGSIEDGESLGTEHRVRGRIRRWEEEVMK